MNTLISICKKERSCLFVRLTPKRLDGVIVLDEPEAFLWSPPSA